MHPSQHIPGDAARTERRAGGSDLDREGFRPVALPALAAAIKAVNAVRRDPRTVASAVIAARLVHEDAPPV